jgi:hypothetical protein
MHTSRRILAEIISMAQKRGEMRRDIAPIELARLVQTVVMGFTMAWALNPQTQFQAMAKKTWDLIRPSLQADTTRQSMKRKGSSKK